MLMNRLLLGVGVIVRMMLVGKVVRGWLWLGCSVLMWVLLVLRMLMLFLCVFS